MSNTAAPANPNPHNLPPALARAQRPLVEPSLASLGIDAFEPAKPGEPGPKGPKAAPPSPPPAPPADQNLAAAAQALGVDQAIPGSDRTVTTAVAVTSGDPALFVYIAVFAIKKGPAHTNVRIEVPCTG